MGYTLGLDIGVNSIGWAVVESTEDFDFKSLLGMGSRVFEAGLDKLENGKGESRNSERRKQRLIRRQTLRKSRRLNKIFHYLQRNHLLPEGHNTIIFNEMDKKFFDIYIRRESIPLEEQHRMAHLIPYFLREKGLTDKLSHYELGRALYHMAHRRGFKSNRKDLNKKDKKTGEVQTDINSLRMDMQGHATLGAYFCILKS